ncbi:MAG: hypothetical protein JXB36_12700 [Gammaproteobacteria bacterium]|nr:hypothetical protein [Gammaproteobacteria bacterium]
MKPLITVMSACALSFLGTVGAQQAEPPEEEAREGIPASPHQEQALREVRSDLFERLDQNRDGSISRAEAQAEASLSGNWSEYDENGDQVLDPQEFSAFDAGSTASAEGERTQVARGELTEEGLPATRHQQQVVREDLVEELDEDGDGGISREEAQGEARLIEEWDELDRNSDGQLESTELALLEE